MAQSLSNLPIGAKIKFGKHSINGETAQPIIWRVVARNHSSTPTYPNNSVTFLTEKIIDLRAFDAKEPSNSDNNRKNHGNSTYSLSNLDQWLNSDKTSWYTPTHSADQSPDNANLLHGAGYDTRPGFLTNFTDAEKTAILTTQIRCATYNFTYEDISRKIFLPSNTEVGRTVQVEDGNSWGYFTDDLSRCADVTAQCRNYSVSTNQPGAGITSWQWWLRSASAYYTHSVESVSSSGSEAPTPAYHTYGVRPAMNLSSTMYVSDATDSDGCYTIVWNQAPPTPTTLNVPTVYGGKSTQISWSKVTDPDGNNVTYQLEQSIDGVEFATIYTGSNLAYTTIVPHGTTNVQFRVKAVDSVGASSEYLTSANITVINNNPPVISGTDSNLGTQFVEFTQTYSVADANNNTVTITESIDGVALRSYTATLGTEYTFSVTGNTWLTLANGIHTMTITAFDGIDSSVRNYTFTKAVTSFSVQRTTAIESSTMPTRIKAYVIKNIPIEATFTVEACNNGFDPTPTWEDITLKVLENKIHDFTNKTKAAAKWGVNIRVTVQRNNGSGACYITSVGGNFE